MGGVTLTTGKIAKLQSYDEAAVHGSHLPMCENCQFWLQHLIKGDFENFDG